MGQTLILDGHSRAAVEAIQSLGRCGIKVIAAAEKPDATGFSSRYPTEKLAQPKAIPSEDFIRWLEEFHARTALDLIIPCTENSLHAFLLMPEDQPLRRRAVLPTSTSLRVALDKNLTHQLANRLGIPVPSTRLVQSLADLASPPKFPSVLKPVHSKVAEGDELKTFEPAIVRDVQAWSSILSDWIPRMAVLEQEYVQGWGVGIEMLYREGQPVWHFGHERLHEWPLTGGASTYRRAIEPSKEMLEASKTLLDSLEWHGVAMIEYKVRPDHSFTLMEVNPRLWGSLALSIDAGVNFPLGLWKIATGQNLPPQPRFRVGVRTRHISGDLQWLKANLLADRTDSLLLRRPVFRSFLEMALPMIGREAWDHFQWTDPGPLLHEFRQLLVRAGRGLRHRWRLNSFYLRRRAFTKRAVARMSVAWNRGRPSILFVCQANVCRSPFAATVAKRILHDLQIESAGFDARLGRPTPPNVSEQAKRLGFDMSECASQSLTPKHVRNADLIFVMELGQLERLRREFPDIQDRVIPLGLFSPGATVEIEDPNHKDAATTKRVLVQIASAIQAFASALNSSVGSATSRRLATKCS